MPDSTLFRVRLDAPDDSGAYRDVTVQADTEDDARAVCEAKEQRIVAQALAENDETVEPYTVTSIEEV